MTSARGKALCEVATPGVRLKTPCSDDSAANLPGCPSDAVPGNDAFFKSLHQPHEAIERKSLNGEGLCTAHNRPLRAYVRAYTRRLRVVLLRRRRMRTPSAADSLASSSVRPTLSSVVLLTERPGFLRSRGAGTRLPQCCAEHPDHRRRSEGCDASDEWLVCCVGSTFGAEIHSRLHGRLLHSEDTHATLRQVLSDLGVSTVPLSEAIMREHLFIKSPVPAGGVAKPALYRLCKGCVVWAKVRECKINGGSTKGSSRGCRMQGATQPKVAGGKPKGSCWWPAMVLREVVPWSCESSYLVSLFPSPGETATVKSAFLRPFNSAATDADPKDLGIVTQTGVSRALPMPSLCNFSG